MKNHSDEEILAWLVGTLDPWRSVALAHDVARDATLGRRVQALQAVLAAGTPEDPLESRWRLPPPGVAGGRTGACLQVAPVPLLAGDGLHAYDPFDVRIDGIADPDDRRVVVMVRQREDWSVVSPTAPAEDLRLSDLDRAPDGPFVLTLAARPEVGRQCWGVALPPWRAPVGWSLPPEARWAELRDHIYRNAVPIFVFEVDVTG